MVLVLEGLLFLLDDLLDLEVLLGLLDLPSAVALLLSPVEASLWLVLLLLLLGLLDLDLESSWRSFWSGPWTGCVLGGCFFWCCPWRCLFCCCWIFFFEAAVTLPLLRFLLK